MIVLIAGMPRSGSTFSFNVAREVLRARGTTHQQSVDEDVIGAVCRSGGTSHVLVKAHNLDEPSLALARAGAMRIIMTVRRVEDALASWFTAFDAFPEDQSLQIMRNWLKLFAQLRAHSLIVPYEQTDRNPSFAAWRIARYLYPVGPAEAIAIARRYQKAKVKRRADELCVGAPGIVDAGFSHFDEQTFFHRRHVAALQSRPAEQVLSKEALARIRQTLASDIAAAGFGIPAADLLSPSRLNSHRQSGVKRAEHLRGQLYPCETLDNYACKMDINIPLDHKD